MSDDALEVARLPPEMLAAIGKLTVNYNSFEAALYLAFCAMIKDDGRLTESILSGVDSISYKLTTAFAIAEIIQNDTAKTILSCRDEVLSFVSFRNKIAHGCYTISTDGSVTLSQNLFRSRMRTKHTPLTAKDIQHASDRIRSVIDKLTPFANGVVVHLKD